jgi:hypothetical protein
MHISAGLVAGAAQTAPAIFFSGRKTGRINDLHLYIGGQRKILTEKCLTGKSR